MKPLVRLAALRPPGGAASRWSRRCIFLFAVLLGFSSLYSLVSLYLWNQSFIQQEREAPLDHWAATLQKPWFALTCPHIPPPNAEDISSTSNVPFLMISARPKEEVEPVWQSWTQQGIPVHLVKTHDWSVAFVNTQEGCQRRKSFGSRLFAIYQRVLREYLLLNYTASHVVVLEDDAVLVNGTSQAFLQELAWVVSTNLDYYSFYSVDNTSCVYNFGTQAQVFSKHFAERIVHEVDRESFCRLPIDMWIAKQGPWYVTRQKLVEHVGTRLQLP